MIHFPRESLIFFTWFFFHTIHFSCKSFFTRFIFHMIHLFPWDSFVFMWPPPNTHIHNQIFSCAFYLTSFIIICHIFSRFICSIRKFFMRFFFFKHMIQLFFTNHWLSMIHLFLHDSFVTWFFIFTQDTLNFTCNFCLPHHSFITTWFIYVHMIPPHTHHSFFHVIFLHSSFNLTRFLTIHLNSHVLDSFIFHERFFSYARFNRFPLIINW